MRGTVVITSILRPLLYFLTDRDPEKAEARNADRESHRIFCPAQVHLGAVPFDDAGPHHVVGQRLHDAIDTARLAQRASWGEGKIINDRVCESKERQDTKTVVVFLATATATTKAFSTPSFP